ncbi:hypothetical protein ACFQRB_13880 [Halobaculum litoreum]|uniref:Uncharacterized protein n=1 Tax=Halobaculum litoreum TaxID=3031998 RepID=A0ABD5XRL7_9EURY
MDRTTPGRWLLFEGSRLRVTALTVVAVWATVGPVANAVLERSPVAVAHGESLVPLLTTFLSGDLLLLSIVVSVNSLFITQEQIPFDQQLRRIEAVREFRRDMEALVDEPISPAEPARFLRTVATAVLAEAQALAEELEGDSDADADLARFVERLAAQTRTVSDGLRDAEGTLDIILATVDYDYGAQVTGLRRLRTTHGDRLTDDEADRIDRMLDLLQHFATSREHFKTLYITREFTDLSRRWSP